MAVSDAASDCIACTGQVGWATDGPSCSATSGLETNLICAAAGGAAGHYVDTDGTATECAEGTYSAAGEDSTTECGACTSQTGCDSDGAACSAVSGLETNLICAAAGGLAGYYVDADGTAPECAAGTYSAAGEDATAACDACTSQTGCDSNGPSVPTRSGLWPNLTCTDDW